MRRSHGGSYPDEETSAFMFPIVSSSPRPLYHHPALSSSAPSTFRFSRLPLSPLPPPTGSSFLSSALSSTSSLPTTQLLSCFIGKLEQLQDLLAPLRSVGELPGTGKSGEKGEGKDTGKLPGDEEDGLEATWCFERDKEGHEEQRTEDTMIRRLLVHPDHQSQQNGLRDELEAATVMVTKLRDRIARITTFVHFMARHGVVSEAAAGTYGYFAALPNELILCILSHTDPRTLLLSVGALNRTWRQLAEDSNVWGMLYGKRWSSNFPSHANIPRSASFYDMDVDDYHPREGKLKRRRYGWMERFKERACVDRNWMKKGAYSVCVKRVETAGHCTVAASTPVCLLLAQRHYIHGERRFVMSQHKWAEQGAFTDETGTTVVTPHRSDIVGIAVAHPDLAVTSSSDGTALAWDLATGALLHRVAHDGEIVQARLASSSVLITASGTKVGMWDMRTGERTGELDHQHAVRCIGVNDDGDSPIVSGSVDGIVRVWDPRKLDAPVAMLPTGGVPTALHLHKRGLLVAGNHMHHEGVSQRPAAYLQRWRSDQLSFSDSLRKPARQVAADDSRVLLAQGSTVVAYDIAAPGLLATYDSGYAGVDSIIFDPTRLLVVGDGRLTIHDFSGLSLESFGYRQLHGVRVL